MILTKARSKEFSDRLKAVVLDALNDKGLSARQVSIDVTGHDGLIRDIKNNRIPSADRLDALFEHLGIDVSLAPRLSHAGKTSVIPNWRGFAEEQLQIEGRSEALALGYEPILYDAEAGGIDNLSPFALSRDWVAEQGLNMPDLRCMRVLKGQGGGFFAEGDIIVVDTGVDGSYGGDVCAFYPSVMSGLQIGRLATIKKIRIAAFNSERGLQQVELKPGSKVVGRVVYAFTKVEHDD